MSYRVKDAHGRTISILTHRDGDAGRDLEWLARELFGDGARAELEERPGEPPLGWVSAHSSGPVLPVYQVKGAPPTTPNLDFDARVQALSIEASAAGDAEQVELCRRALEGDLGARLECLRVLEMAEAMHADDEGGHHDR